MRQQRSGFQEALRNISYIKKARIACSKWPIVIKLAKWNPFAPNLIWIVPAEIFFLFVKGGWPVSAILLLYVFYGMNIVNHKPKEISANSKKDIQEMKKTMSEKEIRSYCKDQAFANALAQHRKDYAAYTKKYVDRGEDLKKGPIAQEVKEWSKFHWDVLKTTEEEQLLRKFGLQMEEK